MHGIGWDALNRTHNMPRGADGRALSPLRHCPDYAEYRHE